MMYIVIISFCRHKHKSANDHDHNHIQLSRMGKYYQPANKRKKSTYSPDMPYKIHPSCPASGIGHGVVLKEFEAGW
jgi:hypothetical protein